MIWPDLLPNPRNVSNTLMAQSSSHENDRCLTNLVWLWGQFLDHDITLTPTDPDEGEPIPIEDPSDPFYPSKARDRVLPLCQCGQNWRSARTNESNHCLHRCFKCGK